MYRHSYHLVLAIGMLMLQLATAFPAHATLKFYYDPATGNVSFDTSETRSGGIYSYYFSTSRGSAQRLEFRYENFIRLSGTSLSFTDSWSIGEGSFSSFWQGLYTIGDILPTGLSEDTWKTYFTLARTIQGPRYSRTVASPTGAYYLYTDVVGGGTPPEASFIYGRPEDEFQNKWDLVDADSLTWATRAQLIYHPWDGEVLIDTAGENGGYISSFELRSKGEFLPEKFTPFATGPLIGADVDTVFQFADAIEPGRYSLGHILPPGLSAQEYEATFAEANFLSRAGFKFRSFDFETDGIAMSLQFVPEPSALLLACAALTYGFASSRQTLV